MTHFAMVVVVDAADEDHAYGTVSSLLGLQDPKVDTVFIGEPWSVKPIEPEQRDVNLDGEQITVEPTFGTLEAFDQHPER